MLLMKQFLVESNNLDYECCSVQDQEISRVVMGIDFLI